MLLLYTMSVIIFFQTEPNPFIRDTVINCILSDQDDEAIKRSEESISASKENVDPILLGYLYYAYENILSLSIPPRIQYLGKKEELNLMTGWNELFEKYPASMKVLKIYCFLAIGTNDEKAAELAEKIRILDSLDGYPEFVYGYILNLKDSLADALPFYRQTYLKDTMFSPVIEKLSGYHFLKENYDSVFYYNKRSLDIINLKKSIYPRYQNLYDELSDIMTRNLIVCCLKDNNVPQAEDLLTNHRKMVDTLFNLNISQDISAYLNAKKNNTLSKSDTFFIPNVGFGTAAILTADSIQILSAAKYFKIAEPIKKVTPKYPKEAHNKHYQGETRIKALVDERGKVIASEIVVSSGYAILDESALKAAKMFIFKPATFFGKPFKMWVAIPFNFKLDNPNDWLKK